VFNATVNDIKDLFVEEFKEEYPQKATDLWQVTHDEVYSIQHYVIKFVSDLRQIGGFLWVLQFPPPIKLTATI
jgi:hypothetical protein